MAEIARNIRSSFHVCMQFFAQLNTPFSASSFQILGAFFSFISQPFIASLATLRSSIFYLIRMRFVTSFNEITASTIQILIGFALLKFQGNDESPFATHPIAMHIAISGLIIYFVAYATLPRFPLRRFADVAHHCLVLSGYASVASLASILLPDSVTRYVYAIFALLPACVLMYSLYEKLVAEENDAEFWAFGRRFPRFLNNMLRVEGSSSYTRRFRRFFNSMLRVEGNSSGRLPPRLTV